ncbi:MAG: sulfatase [Acidobacteria bacterium]|nr:sulfatase [Acidobacteriota bacterium]
MHRNVISRRQLLAGGAGWLAGAEKPNILFVLADDLGWKDTGFNGSDFYETPNLDRLKGEGMIFSQAYACGANCAPSRACLLSGQYTPRHGVYAVGSTKRGPVKKMRLEPVPNKEYLEPSTVTLAEALRSAGYATGLFGKWHLGAGNGSEPKAQGFDEYFDPRLPDPNRKRDLPDDPKGIYSLTRAAGAFMEKNRHQPFFAYVAHHAIHSTLEARPATLEKFRAKAKGAQHSNALYAACVYDLDDGVGQLLRRLSELDLQRNTLLVFTSDNGGTQQSLQEPLRGSKGCYYEGGIREPMIVRWPGRVAAGSSCAVPVASVDFYPTLLEAAGGRRPAGQALDGESLLPLFTGRGKLKREAIYWHFPGYLDVPVPRGRDNDFRTRPVSVIRKGDWKLLLYHEEWQLDGGHARIAGNHAVELFNIAEDVGERRDLAQDNSAKREELLRDLLLWCEKIRAPLPERRNPEYAPG